MSSNQSNLVPIFLDTLLLSCLVLAGLSDISVANAEPKLSSPAECARTCYADEPPKTCHYHFTIERYTVLGNACQLCTPNDTNPLLQNCQCVTADGIERSLLTVNRMLPGPSIEVCLGDRVVIDVLNSMDRMEVGIHWHGVHQQGSQYYDGVPFLTQCPIQEGNTFRYQWVAENAGTHFWHSHAGLLKMDGIWGSLIVREPICKDPNSYLYDADLSTHVMMISDWLHKEATERYPGLLKTEQNQIPESALINGKGQYANRNNGSRTKTPLQVFTVKSGCRFRFRMINAFCSTCAAQLNIQGHTLTLIATDGVPVHPVNVDSIVSLTGERYDFVINADQPPGAYWIQLRALGHCESDEIQQLAILRYEGWPETPCSKPPTYNEGLPHGVVLNPLDGICDNRREDAVCINHLKHTGTIDVGIREPEPDVKIFLPINLYFYSREELFQPKTYKPWLGTGNGSTVLSLVDGFGFKFPSSPPLSQIDDIPPEEFCNEYNRSTDNCGGTCMCTLKFDIPLNSIVEVILVDESASSPEISHSFHMHGYAFNVIGMGRYLDWNMTEVTLDHVRDFDRRGLLKRNFRMAPFKDTIAVPNGGYAILRFRADNPGYWLFESPILGHISSGTGAILHVGTDEDDLPPVPRGFPVCGNYLPSILPAPLDPDLFSSCLNCD